MKREILDYLVCPACLPEENRLSLGLSQRSGREISEGNLKCGCCGRAYYIRSGVARLTEAGGQRPEDGKQNSLPRFATSVYESPELVSAYLWSHYADLFEDPDASGAYSQWAGQISTDTGAALDAGCAVGRFCFEMSRKFDLVIGVDLSEAFISTARKIMQERKMTFQLKEEGRILSERTFFLPDLWDSNKVEFIVADASALPFRSGSFACVASLNLLDKVARPLDHISETCRMAIPGQAQLLISDPFSWSESACAPDKWLGGAPGGRFAGFGIDNIINLLSDAGAPLLAGNEAGFQTEVSLLPGSRVGARGMSCMWKIARSGAVWWKIRNHRNHFELIRSLFVKAERHAGIDRLSSEF